MASYSVNERAVARARQLIDARQYVLDSDWGDVQPSADDENAFLASHSWDDYAEWHLGLTEGACVYRASEWRHKGIELAAHDLLQHLDNTSA
jgi:hypothetical protein